MQFTYTFLSSPSCKLYILHHAYVYVCYLCYSTILPLYVKGHLARWRNTTRKDTFKSTTVCQLFFYLLIRERRHRSIVIGANVDIWQYYSLRDKPTRIQDLCLVRQQAMAILITPQCTYVFRYRLVLTFLGLACHESAHEVESCVIRVKRNKKKWRRALPFLADNDISRFIIML